MSRKHESRNERRKRLTQAIGKAPPTVKRGGVHRDKSKYSRKEKNRNNFDF